MKKFLLFLVLLFSLAIFTPGNVFAVEPRAVQEQSENPMKGQKVTPHVTIEELKAGFTPVAMAQAGDYLVIGLQNSDKSGLVQAAIVIIDPQLGVIHLIYVASGRVCGCFVEGDGASYFEDISLKDETAYTKLVALFKRIFPELQLFGRGC